MIFLGGTHPRHLYVANRLNEKFGLEYAVLEERGTMLPNPPPGPDAANWTRHFGERLEAERREFGHPEFPSCRHRLVKNINDAPVPPTDRIIVFGCGMIRRPMKAVNVHLGLSPRYRGAATLFWPFYFLEPQWAGVTIHWITDEPDAGDVIHQCRPPLFSRDGIHDVGARAVKVACDDLISLLELDSWKTRKQRATGKNFLASDFRPQMLRMLYDVYDNDIVEAYLQGELGGTEPGLFQDNLN